MVRIPKTFHWLNQKTDCNWFLELLKISSGREGISFSCVIAVPISSIFSSFLFVDGRREREREELFSCVCARDPLPVLWEGENSELLLTSARAWSSFL